MDVLEAVRTRRSVGKVDGDVSNEEIRELLAAAVCAPNHKLTAPWRFTVVRGGARERLGAAWSAIVARTIERVGEERDATLLKEARKPMRAPVLIVVSVRTDTDPVVATEDYAAGAAAVQNLLLAAHARGLGAMWRTGAMAYHDEIKTHLGIAPSDRIVAVVYVGRPAMNVLQPPERQIEGITRWLE